jgi:hypothetical protein
MWGGVGLVRADVSEERVVSIFRVEIISEIKSTLVVTSLVTGTTEFAFLGRVIQFASKC